MFLMCSSMFWTKVLTGGTLRYIYNIAWFSWLLVVGGEHHWESNWVIVYSFACVHLYPECRFNNRKMC